MVAGFMGYISCKYCLTLCLYAIILNMNKINRSPTVSNIVRQGRRGGIEMLDKNSSKEGAMELYEQLPEHAVEFEEAFPGELVEEA